MEKFDKWFLPDGEQHLQHWMKTVGRRVDGRLTYQYGKYEEAMPYIKNKRLSIDVGAHVGLWSYFMARDFEHVACFEPLVNHQMCWHENMRDKKNAELFECALGAEKGTVAMETRAASSGDTQVDLKRKGDIEMNTLDSFNFSAVDFIKIDCEGYELNVLKGAEKTLLACKPCVLVEQKGDMIKKYGGEKLGAVKYLESLGAIRRKEISGDYILSWPAENQEGAL